MWGKRWDAHALVAASRIDVVHYRETGEIRFLPDVYATAQNYASMNSTFLRARSIGVAVTGITVDPATWVVYVTVSADLSLLIPGMLAFQGVYSVTGYAEVMVN
ncbi:MAG: hypothetical protein Q8N45_05150 [Anaerolineales bacterium]|nr:hypothetical protein [Anaerolineales bacterium]